MATVLKTVECHSSVGSNPTSSVFCVEHFDIKNNIESVEIIDDKNKDE